MVMIRLDQDLRDLLQTLADAEGRTLSDFCRDILKNEATMRVQGPTKSKATSKKDYIVCKCEKCRNGGLRHWTVVSEPCRICTGRVNPLCKECASPIVGRELSGPSDVVCPRCASK